MKEQICRSNSPRGIMFFFSEASFLCNDYFTKHHMLSPLAAASGFGLVESDIELAGEEITLK